MENLSDQFLLSIKLVYLFYTHVYPYSDTSGPENVSSGSEAEADSDADNVFLPSRGKPPTSANDTESDDPVRARSIPRTLNLGR